MKTITFDETKWQVVPREPDGAMLSCAATSSTRKAMYRAMLAAAPEPATAQHTEAAVERMSDLPK